MNTGGRKERVLVEKENIFNGGTSQPWSPEVQHGGESPIAKERGTSSLTPKQRGCVLDSGFNQRIMISCEGVSPDPGAGDFSTGRRRASLERC